jgi:hypothetical protein
VQNILQISKDSVLRRAELGGADLDLQDFHFAARLVFDMYQTDHANVGVNRVCLSCGIHDDMKTDIAKPAILSNGS